MTFKTLSLSKQPLLILVICFILGICFQDRVSLYGTSVYAIVGGSLLIVASLLFSSYFLHTVRSYLLGFLFFGAGIIFHYFNMDDQSNKYIHPISSRVVFFKISKKLNSNSKYKKYEAVIQTGKECANSLVYVPQYNEELDFNHYYKSKAYIIQSKPSQHDFQFDYAKYLNRKGIHYQTYVSEISSIVRNDLTLSEKIAQKRVEVLQNIDKVQMSEKSRTFLKGLILADRTEIDPETVRDFSRSGLVHFLSISGTHIVVIFGVFYFLFVQLLPLKLRKYAVILSLIFIWLFAGFIGFGNSVLRSCIMLSVYFIYILLQRKPDLPHSLALSAFIILISDTYQVFDIGFQLSFIAVLGIFWLNQPILKYFPKQDNYFKRLMFNTISISLSAQLATLPLVLLYFHQFSGISIIANFFIVPFSEIIIVYSFVLTAIIAAGINISAINIIYDSIIHVLLEIIHWFADFNGLFFENIPMNGIETLVLFVIVYLMRFVMTRFDFKNSMRLIMVVFMFFIIRFTFNIIEDQKDEVLVSDFYKNKVLSVKKGGVVCFWVKGHSEKAKVLQYIIKPYIVSRRIHSVEIKISPDHAQKVVYHGKIYDIN